MRSRSPSSRLRSDWVNGYPVLNFRAYHAMWSRTSRCVCSIPWAADCSGPLIAGDVAVAFSRGGVSSLFARPEKVSPSDAALANGTAIHGFEIDDAHLS